MGKQPSVDDPSLAWVDEETRTTLLGLDKVVWVFPENHEVYNLFIELLNLSVWRLLMPPMGGKPFYLGFDWAQIHPYWQINGEKPLKQTLQKLHFLEQTYCNEMNK